jgi:single stranded DNA-binding protein
MSAVPAVLAGNVVADIELATTPTGKKFARFRVATNERYRKADGQWADREAVFWNCEAWNEPAEAIAQQFKKGSAVVKPGSRKTQGNAD